MTMTSKLDLLTSETNKMAKAQASANEAPTAQVAAQEQCRRIVADLQDIAKKLATTKPHTLDAIATEHVHPEVEALAVATVNP